MMRTITAFDRLKEEAAQGAIRDQTLLEGMAESVRDLANAHESAALKCSDPDVEILLASSAGILRTVASNITLHGLTHLRDKPRPIDEVQAEIQVILSGPQ